MPLIVVLLLFLMFSNHFTGLLTGSNIWESGMFSPDKLFKLGVIGLALGVLIFRPRRFKVPGDVWRYILPAVFVIGILALNQKYTSSTDDFSTFRATKELVRLATILFIFFLCAVLEDRKASFRAFLYVFATAGLVLSCLAVRQSMEAESARQWAYVGEFVRAGTGITGPNILGAVLNVTSVVAMIGFFAEQSRARKLFFISIFVVIQVARFSTFSTGAFASFAITLVAMFFLLRKHRPVEFRQLWRISALVVILLVAFLIKTGLVSTVFYRVMLSDEKVKQASVYSRIEQYRGLAKLIEDKPSILLSGVGTADLSDELGAGHDMHNSFLRPLGTAGILGFTVMIMLWVFSFRNYLFAMRASVGDDTFRLVSLLFMAAFIGWSFQAATIPCDSATEHWFFIILGYLLARQARLRLGRQVERTATAGAGINGGGPVAAGYYDSMSDQFNRVAGIRR